MKFKPWFIPVGLVVLALLYFGYQKWQASRTESPGAVEPEGGEANG